MHDMSVHFGNKYFEGSNLTTSFRLSVFNALHIILVANLAKVLHDVTASASILFAQVACRGLKLTLVPPQKHALDQCPQSHANINSWYDFPCTLCEQVSLTSQGLPLVCPLDKTPAELRKSSLSLD